MISALRSMISAARKSYGPSRLALVLAVAGSSPALAQAVPDWDINALCRSEPGQCIVSEELARDAVTGGWNLLPVAYREACLAAVKSPADHSWRLLSQCLEEQVLAGLGERAIRTAATPAEPEPAPEPAATPVPGPAAVQETPANAAANVPAPDVPAEPAANGTAPAEPVADAQASTPPLRDGATTAAPPQQ